MQKTSGKQDGCDLKVWVDLDNEERSGSGVEDFAWVVLFIWGVLIPILHKKKGSQLQNMQAMKFGLDNLELVIQKPYTVSSSCI